MIVHLNPPEQLLGYTMMGRKFIKNKRIIGFWHWELPSVPSFWRVNARFVHEIWAPSRFTAEAISNQVSTEMTHCFVIAQCRYNLAVIVGFAVALVQQCVCSYQ